MKAQTSPNRALHALMIGINVLLIVGIFFYYYSFLGGNDDCTKNFMKRIKCLSVRIHFNMGSHTMVQKVSGIQ